MNGVVLRHDTTAIRGTMTIIHTGIKCWFVKQRYDKIPDIFPYFLEKVCPPLDKGGFGIVYLSCNSQASASHRQVMNIQEIAVREELAASNSRL